MSVNAITIFRLVALCALVLPSALVWPQPYPLRPVRIVTSEPGSGNDILARIVADGLTSSLPHRIGIFFTTTPTQHRKTAMKCPPLCELYAHERRPSRGIIPPPRHIAAGHCFASIIKYNHLF